MPASITLTVSHLASSTSFFLACLQPLGYVYRGRVNDTIGFGHPNAPPDFWITQCIPGVPPGPAHVAFPAGSREGVHQFFYAAVKTGAKVHGEPALRDVESGYYSAAVIDFDGNSIEAVFRPDITSPSEQRISDARSVTSQEPRPHASTAVSFVSKAKSTTPVVPSTSISSSSVRAPNETLPTAESAPSRPPSHRRGDLIDNFLEEAKGTIAVAKDLVNSARPAASQSSNNKEKTLGTEGPSGAVVGTLLGVAAGAALHYALGSSKRSSAPASSEPHPGIARSETAPSYTNDRYRFSHSQSLNSAVDAPPSSYRGGHRQIELIDNDQTLSESISTVKPQRRNSFAGTSTKAMPVEIYSSDRSRKTIEALPPSSYRGPAIVVDVDTRSTASHRPSRTRASALPWHTSTGSTGQANRRREDEGYASATDSRSSKHSSHPRRSLSLSSRSRDALAVTAPRLRSGFISNSKYEQARRSEDEKSSILTAIRTKPNQNSPSHIDPTTQSRNNRTSTRTRTRTRLDHPDTDTNSSSAASATGSRTKRASKHHTPTASHMSKTSRSSGRAPAPVPVPATVKLTASQLARLDDGGRIATKSTVGKIRDIDRLSLSPRDVRPEDSISQV